MYYGEDVRILDNININNYIKSNDEAVKSLERKLNQMSDKLESLNERSLTQQNLIDQLEKANTDQMLKRKKQNIIIEGLIKKKDVNTKDAVVSLLSGIGVNAQTQIVIAFRLGNVNKQTTCARPRLLFVKLTTQTFKFKIYKNVKKLKTSDDWKQVYIKDDLSTDVAQQRQDMKCLAALACNKGYAVAVRGAALIVDNKRYTYMELDNHPDDLTMENPKTIAVDNDSLAFQSHDSYLSSMFPCSFDYNGHTHTSTEHIFWYDIAKLAENQTGTEHMRAAKDGYAAKQIGGRFSLTPETPKRTSQGQSA